MTFRVEKLRRRGRKTNQIKYAAVAACISVLILGTAAAGLFLEIGNRSKNLKCEGIMEETKSDGDAGQTEGISSKIIKKIKEAGEDAGVILEIPQLAENNKLVVYGEVLGTELILEENGGLHTNIDMKVICMIKGSYHSNVIRIVKRQGTISAKKYIESFTSDELKNAERQKYSEYSDDELDNVYIEKITENDMMAEIGQKGIYFLKKSADYDGEKTYTRTAGPASEYLEQSEDRFVQTEAFNSSSDYDIYSINEIVSMIINKQ